MVLTLRLASGRDLVSCWHLQSLDASHDLLGNVAEGSALDVRADGDHALPLVVVDLCRSEARCDGRDLPERHDWRRRRRRTVVRRRYGVRRGRRDDDWQLSEIGRVLAGLGNEPHVHVS